jgi:hypothetical protein
MSIDEKVISKIRKLMAVANGNASGGEHERDTALKMALNLLAKHNLAMSDVKQADQEGRKSEEVGITSHAWIRCFISPLAQMFFCTAFTTKLAPFKMKVTFIGLESNVATATEMFKYIIKSISKEASRLAREGGLSGPFERSFCNGAGKQISSRCCELKHEAESESEAYPTKSNGTALVLASLYKTEACANLNYSVDVLNVHLYRGKNVNPQSKSKQAFDQGQAFGSKLNLSKQLK